MVEGLPDPARRYFLHAIRPGSPLAATVYWQWSGEMRPSKQMGWVPLTSEQVSAKDRGYVWRAKARRGLLRLTAVDHFRDGEGRMRIALFGLVPVVNETGPDLSRSALGRLLIEGIIMPSFLLPGPHVRITGVDASRFQITLEVGGEEASYILAVDEEGRLTKESVLQRWGNVTDDGSFRHIPYGGTIEEERTFGGYTIPTRIEGGWWYGTERYFEVLHLKLDSIRYE
jgi:hypothetical protein